QAAVIVATIRALKMHGGVAKDALGTENVAAVKDGLANLGRHIDNVNRLGVPAIVAVNMFTSDTDAEFEAVRVYCAERGVDAVKCTHWADGGKGTEELAARVAEIADSGKSAFKPLYGEEMGLWDKVRTIARTIYGAEDIAGDKAVRDQFKQLEE